MNSLIVIVFQFIYIIPSYAYHTQLRCPDSEIEPWAVRYDDNAEATKRFQDWLYAYHHKCNYPNRRIDKLSIPEIGIGSTLQYVTNQMMWAVSDNQIHRPTSTFAFAETNPENCTLKISSIDCYFLPMSPCDLENGVDPSDFDPRKNLNVDEVLGNFSVTHGHVCTLARVMKKPVQWVHSQYIEYLMRPRYDIAKDVEERLKIVFKKKRLNPEGSSVIGVHVRDGNTYDFGRRVLNITTYIEYIDKRAADLEARGKPVVTVFLCSHLQEHNIVSSEHMNSLFPRRFEFIVLPHVIVPHVPYHMELDDALSNKTIRDAAPLRQMFVEYLADVEILAQSDVLIGVTSNIYTLVVAKRIARDFHLGNDTCYIDSRRSDTPLICEDNPESHDIWKMYFGHLHSPGRNPDPGMGYETGTPFYDYKVYRPRGMKI